MPLIVLNVNKIVLEKLIDRFCEKANALKSLNVCDNLMTICISTCIREINTSDVVRPSICSKTKTDCCKSESIYP